MHVLNQFYFRTCSQVNNEAISVKAVALADKIQVVKMPELATSRYNLHNFQHRQRGLLLIAQFSKFASLFVEVRSNIACLIWPVKLQLGRRHPCLSVLGGLHTSFFGAPGLSTSQQSSIESCTVL